MKLNRLLSTALLAAAMALSPVTGTQVSAQDQTEGAEIVSQDGKLDAFIVAALAVSETRQHYIERLEAETDEAAQMAIVQEADAAILEVLNTSPDITVEEYVAIGEAAAADPELAALIDARFVEAFTN
jgi:seryl-tRNA(Sec) selenium transferase